MNAHAIENAKTVDPAGTILAKLQEAVDAWPVNATPLCDFEMEALLLKVTAALGMSLLRRGTVSQRPGVPLEWDIDIQGWSFDVREWMKREHGAVQITRRAGGFNGIVKGARA